MVSRYNYPINANNWSTNMTHTHGKLTPTEQAQVKALKVKKFIWQGCEYTFNPTTKMVGGHMEFHIAHATPDMRKHIASMFPTVI